VTPLLLDINGPEFLLLLVLAIILFGPERLPDLARKAARVVQYLRTVAGSAQEQISKELGPGFENLDLRDLNPKTFIQKHLLDEVEPIVADVKSELTDVAATVSGASGDVSSAINGVRGTDPTMPNEFGEAEAAAEPPRVLTPFDPDAT
jgi:sec-independent protein translocase protein TatB